MASILTLTFTKNGVVNESIDFTGTGSLLTVKNTRSAPKQVTVQDAISRQIDRFLSAIDIDYNTRGIYTFEFTATTLSITHEDNDHFNSFVDGTHNNTTFISTSLTTNEQRIAITITNEFTPADADFCNKVKTTLVPSLLML